MLNPSFTVPLIQSSGKTSSPGQCVTDGAVAPVNPRAWMWPVAGTASYEARIFYLAAFAWEIVFILEVFRSPRALHWACKRLHSGKSLKIQRCAVPRTHLPEKAD